MVDGRLPCVVELKVTGESARGDTPLRALLEGLAYCAIVEANAADIASEDRRAAPAVGISPDAGRHGAGRLLGLVLEPPEDGDGGSLPSAISSRAFGTPLGLDACLLALLDARFEMGLSGEPARLTGRCRMVAVDEGLISGVRG